MTAAAEATSPASAGAASDEAPNYLTHETGWKSWAFTVDHKRIGLMYLVSIIVSFFLGGIMALLVRTELMFPGTDFLEADQYNRAFTLHGAIMVFMFIMAFLFACLAILIDFL